VSDEWRKFQTVEERLAEVEAERGRLQAIVDDWSRDGAEYRHALGHVVDCEDNCRLCRDLAQDALSRTTMGKLP
jgi:hypothetical protein